MAEAASLPMGVPPGAPPPVQMDTDPEDRQPLSSDRVSVHRPRNAPENPEESNVLGVFGISIRTQERDLEDEFGRIGSVDKVVVVYDQRTQRSRGFGFVTMADVDAARDAIEKLNGTELHGRRIRVDFSVTKRPHDPTPGKYMGEKDERSYNRDRDYRRPDYDRGYDRGYDRDRSYSRSYRDDYHDRRDSYDDRDRYRSRDYDRSYDYDRSSRRRSRSRSPRRDRAPLPDDRR